MFTTSNGALLVTIEIVTRLERAQPKEKSSFLPSSLVENSLNFQCNKEKKLN
jgi:hypothetical protein